MGGDDQEENFGGYGSEKSVNSNDSCPELNDMELDWGEIIGSGHTCDVYRGRFNGMEVAIKQFRGNRSSLAHEELLAREIAVMALARHPNIVLLHGVVTMNPPLKIVMEMCHGGSLFELLHQQRKVNPTWKQMLAMCKDVSVAMDYMHQFTPCLIHRDLKSLNILLAEQLTSVHDVPVTKVCDLGLARMLDTKTAMTLGVGTNHWMAPEIVGGSKYDEKVDIYSFAMVQYEIFCRTVPFLHEAPMELRRKVMNGIRPDLALLGPQCPASIRSLITSCWAANPKKRPSFKQIIKILDNAGTESVTVSL